MADRLIPKDLTNSLLADHAYDVANKINQRYGKHPDADIVREAANRIWTMGKEDEAKKAPTPTKKTVQRKSS